MTNLLPDNHIFFTLDLELNPPKIVGIELIEQVDNAFSSDVTNRLIGCEEFMNILREEKWVLDYVVVRQPDGKAVLTTKPIKIFRLRYEPFRLNDRDYVRWKVVKQ